MSKFVGIDPGASGGIGVIVDGKVFAMKMPESEKEVSTMLQTTVIGADLVVLEKVTGYIGGGEVCPVCHQAKNQSPGSSMFNFGRGVGVLIGCLHTFGISFQEIEPQRWQKMLGLNRPQGMSPDDWKRELKKVAQEMFPYVRVTLAVADGILLARYAQLQSEGFVESEPLI